jgi:hypothetical protein
MQVCVALTERARFHQIQGSNTTFDANCPTIASYQIIYIRLALQLLKTIGTNHKYGMNLTGSNSYQGLYLSNIPAIATENFCSNFYSVRSQHVSAPTGHPQVKYTSSFIYFWKCHRYHNGSVVLQLFTHVVSLIIYLQFISW